jgi:hypothetical protein
MNENIEKYSIKMPKNIMKRKLHEFNHKKRQYLKLLNNITIK